MYAMWCGVVEWYHEVVHPTNTLPNTNTVDTMYATWCVGVMVWYHDGASYYHSP